MKSFLVVSCLLLLVACQPEGAPFNGYVEGEYSYISPTTAGVLAQLNVARGQKVQAGDALFSLDLTYLESARASALAEVAQSRAKWSNLLKGLRPDEIEVILQQQVQAKSALEAALKEYERAKQLIATKAVSQSALDVAKTSFDTAQARVGELAAQLKTATMGAREDEILAAKAAVDVAEQKVVQLEKQLSDAAPKAPVAGLIEDTFFNVGEFITAGAPVVSLLPLDKVKVRFFVPQSRLSALPLGTKVSVSCDGCAKSVAAHISFIGTQSEFTPPVIYSIGSRDKLVFMVEATPEAYDPLLKPGLPVDITPVSP